MGTNYYTAEKPPCDACKRPHEQLHIGKASGGWEFLFAPYPELGLVTAAAWWAFIESRPIIDEYDRPVTLEELKAIVERCRGGDWLTPQDCGGEPVSRYEFTSDDGYRFATDPNFS